MLVKGILNSYHMEELKPNTKKILKDNRYYYSFCNIFRCYKNTKNCYKEKDVHIRWWARYQQTLAKSTSLFNHFLSKKLFTSSQSGFLLEDSCVAQLLSIIHEMQKVFDNNLIDVRGAFWHSQSIWKSLAWWSHF